MHCRTVEPAKIEASRRLILERIVMHSTVAPAAIRVGDLIDDRSLAWYHEQRHKSLFMYSRIRQVDIISRRTTARRRSVAVAHSWTDEGKLQPSWQPFWRPSMEHKEEDPGRLNGSTCTDS